MFFAVKNKIIYRRHHLIVIQKTARMFIAKKQHEPRIKGTTRIKQLYSQLSKMDESSRQVKTERDRFVAEAKRIQSEMEKALGEIKVRSTTFGKVLSQSHIIF